MLHISAHIRFSSGCRFAAVRALLACRSHSLAVRNFLPFTLTQRLTFEFRLFHKLTRFFALHLLLLLLNTLLRILRLHFQLQFQTRARFDANAEARARVSIPIPIPNCITRAKAEGRNRCYQSIPRNGYNNNNTHGCNKNKPTSNRSLILFSMRNRLRGCAHPYSGDRFHFIRGEVRKPLCWALKRKFFGGN